MPKRWTLLIAFAAGVVAAAAVGFFLLYRPLSIDRSSERARAVELERVASEYRAEADGYSRLLTTSRGEAEGLRDLLREREEDYRRAEERARALEDLNLKLDSTIEGLRGTDRELAELNRRIGEEARRALKELRSLRERVKGTDLSTGE